MKEGSLKSLAHAGVVFSVEDVRMPDLINHLRGHHSTLAYCQNQKSSVLLDGLFSKLGSPLVVLAQFSLQSKPFFTVCIIKTPGVNNCCHFIDYIFKQVLPAQQRKFPKIVQLYYLNRQKFLIDKNKFTYAGSFLLKSSVRLLLRVRLKSCPSFLICLTYFTRKLCMAHVRENIQTKNNSQKTKKTTSRKHDDFMVLRDI